MMEENAILGSSEDLSVQSQNTSTICTIHDRIIDILSTECTIGSLKYKKILNELKKVKSLGDITNWQEDCIKLAEDSCDKPSPESVSYPILKTIFDFIWKTDFDAWGQFLNDLINQEQSTEGSRIMLLELFKTIRIDCDDQEFINSAFNLTYQLLEDVDEEASYEEIAIIMESIDHFLFYGTKKTRFFQFKNPKNVFNKIIEWFVESESREKLKSACISLMKHFKNYWKTNLEEAKTMVSILMIDMIAFLVDTEEVAEEDESSDQFRSECLFFVVRSIIRAMPETEDLTFIFEKMEDNSDKFQILTQDKSDKLLVHFLYISDTILFRNDLSNEKGLAFLRGLFDLIMRSGFKPLTFAIKLIRFFDADSKMKLATKVINEQMYEKLWNSDKTIIERSVKTLQDILTSEDTPIIQHIYQLVSQRLLQLTDDLVKMFKEKDIKLNEFNLLASQCSNYLRALVIFLTTKKSPIILMVLNPSIYSLLFEKLPVKCQRFIQSNAQLTALVLITQKCFSLTYGHFVANCVWESKESATSVLQLSPSSKYLQGIINQIVFWLNNFRYLDEETILLLTTWVVSFIKENYAFAMANFYNHTFKKLRRAMALFALKYMGSFKFDDYFEDKGHYMKNGPLDNQEEKTVIDNMNLALVILERSQWIMLQDLDMDMFAQFLRISQNCDHTQFMFMMKVLPANWILKKSLSHQFVPSVQKDPIQYETTPFDKQDYIRIMDFVYQNVNMDSHFQRDFFLKWVFDPNQVIITTNAPNVTIYDKWNAIATKFCVYVIQEHFNTPVGNMTKTILHMQEVSTLLSAEIKELIGIKNEELDLFNEYKAAVQEKIHFKPFGSKSPDSSLQTNPDYEFNFEYEGIDQVFTDRAPLYEEVILRYTLWIKIVYSMIKYIHCGLECPHFLDSNKVDTKFLLDNFAELNQGLKDMVQPVIEIAFRIGDYGSVVKLSEFLIKQIDCSDFIDGQITKFSDEQRIIKLYPWLARAYLRTNSSDSIIGLHNYLKKFLNPKDLKWLDALVLITNGNIEDGLKKLNNLYCPLFQKHIIEIIHECASILRIPNIKNFLNQFEETLNMYDTSENDYLHAHNLFTANSKKMCDWKACSNEVQAEFLAIPDQQIYVNSIETNIAETYEGFNDLKSLNLKKYNRILWQTSELLRTISHTSLFLTPNLSNFSHAYSTFLITEDVKKRLTLRLNKVPFYEDVELQLKGINSQMFVDHCKSNALDSIQIGRKFSHWIQHSGHYIHGSSSSRFHLNMAKVARKTGNINTAKEEFSLYKNVFAKIYKHEHSRDAMEAFVESVKLDQLISINKPNSKNCMHGMTKVLSTYFDQLMNDYMHNDSKKFFNNSPDLTIEDIFTKQYEGDDKTKYCQFRLERVKRLNTASKSILFLADQFLNNTDYSSKQAQMNNPVNGAFKIFLQPYVSYNNMETIYTNYDDQYYNALCKLSAQFSPTNRKAYFKIGEFNFNNSSLNEKDDIILADTAKQFIADLLLHFNICDVDREIEQAVSRSANLVLLRSKISKFLHEGGKIKSCAEQITDQLINYDGFADMFNCHVDQQTKSFTVATQAYFQYLCLSTESVKCSDITKAALLILRMLVKYPFQISRIINQWIQKTNEDVWKNILPQLFARLNHPNKIVRDTVCNMLETVANSSPHVLCFPVVVGKRNIKDEDDEFRQNLVLFGTKMSLNLSGSKAGSKEWDNILIAECCNRLSKYIDLKNPGLIDEVSKFVFEIEKVNMLSDEKWIFVLNKLSSEFRKRVKFYNYHLKSPVDKSLERHEINEIATERLKIGSEPIFKSILDMYESTFAEEAVSTYDKKFIETYGEHLHTAISTFKQQTTINEKSFEPFNELMNIFTENRANKQTSLNSNDLNTYLSSMKSSKIPMPGQDDRRYNSSSFVCINSMNHNIEIISSLTRPKKVQFVGSDGSRNDFLVKGYEDLHLDERVMQILRICNQIINHKKNKRFGNTNALHAGNYSVTPLGLRSGLIKFVGNATPMFGTYYRWQKNYEKNNKNADGSAVKLSELFKKSVQHHCDADSNEKFDITDFRTPANKHAFVAAYNEVTKVIPKNLISNEIWKYSKDANEWWNVTKTYARNVAVMSVIGSLFGIGDRHLSNILINYNTGQITHVDYNVFFDKGKYLRVPEKVPFRLTRSIVDAMGPSKTEGIFKESCVHVLKCLKGADTGIITTVLDTFVYDPLVDWASVDEAGEVNDSVPVGVMFAVYGKSCYDSKLIVETAERLLKLKLRELKNHLQKNCVELEHALKQNIATIRSMHLLSHQCPTKQSDDQKRDCVLALGSALKTHKDCYCQLSRLLKFLAQYDETYANFLDNYRNKFTNPFIRAHVDDSDVQCLSIRLRADLLEQMCNNITKIYEELLSLINYNINFNDQNMYSLKRDTRHNKIAEQVENSKAADIISRIKEKFVTKDSETCEKKIDMLIKEATNIENLSMMFEGWNSWI